MKKLNIDKDRIYKIKTNMFSLQYIISIILLLAYLISSITHLYKGDHIWTHIVIITIIGLIVMITVIDYFLIKFHLRHTQTKKRRQAIILLSNISRILMMGTQIVILFSSTENSDIFDKIIQLAALSYLFYSIYSLMINTKEFTEK